MIWPTNYFKLAAATMFTLFFAGGTFAPECTVEGQTMDDYLQNKFCDAFAALAQRICDTPGLADDVVVGYDTLNEPGFGWVGCSDLSILDSRQELRKGLTPTPHQAMMLGEGLPCDVEVWDFGSFGPKKVGVERVDPNGVSAWTPESGGCIWARHGVWDKKTGELLQKDYFTRNPKTSDPVDFLADFWKPFVRRFTHKLRAVQPQAIIFVEPPVNEFPPGWDETAGDPGGRLCYAPHFYDGLTLISKHFTSWFAVDYVNYLRGKYSHVCFAVKFGLSGVKSAFSMQLATLQEEGRKYLGDYPCLIGEIGIPYDMDDKHAYRTNDFTSQLSAMDANMHALESNLLHFTLWNYCSDNTHAWGDQWNGEDLSLWSRDVPGPDPRAEEEEGEDVSCFRCAATPTSRRHPSPATASRTGSITEDSDAVSTTNTEQGLITSTPPP
ncbi:hypothetical protein HK104_004602, partial [Borealophlyctis nickersoniae]